MSQNSYRTSFYPISSWTASQWTYGCGQNRGTLPPPPPLLPLSLPLHLHLCMRMYAYVSLTYLRTGGVVPSYLSGASPLSYLSPHLHQVWMEVSNEERRRKEKGRDKQKERWARRRRTKKEANHHHHHRHHHHHHRRQHQHQHQQRLQLPNFGVSKATPTFKKSASPCLPSTGFRRTSSKLTPSKRAWRSARSCRPPEGRRRMR
mmetsp:Transcript_37646/g.97128  ORF Transcript_37646/g.97128 Transcript_37646/m.97128 type:complete len:204 (+) Transcript_37646:931-1542(+)